MRNQAVQSKLPYSVMLWYSTRFTGQFAFLLYFNGTSNLKLTVIDPLYSLAGTAVQGYTGNHFVPTALQYVTVFAKRDHLGANLDFEFCILLMSFPLHFTALR